MLLAQRRVSDELQGGPGPLTDFHELRVPLVANQGSRWVQRYPQNSLGFITH